MKRAVFVVLIICMTVTGCTNAPQVVKDLADTQRNLLSAHNQNVKQMADQLKVVYAAQAAQKVMTQEEAEEAIQVIDSILHDGETLSRVHDALEGWLDQDIDWLTTVNDVRHAVTD